MTAGHSAKGYGSSRTGSSGTWRSRARGRRTLSSRIIDCGKKNIQILSSRKTEQQDTW